MATPSDPLSPAPLRGYHFRLEVDGYTGYFSRCTDLRVRVGTIPYSEGGGPIRWLAGQIDESRVTLEYCVIPSVHPGLWMWFDSAMRGNPIRKSPSIILLDHQGVEQMRYNLFACWPCEWTAPRFDTLGRHLAVETLTLVYEKIDRA